MGNEKKKLTGVVKSIAVLSIALGLAVMILAVSVVTGFQAEIRDKVIGFGSHIQITNFDYNVSYEAKAVSINQDFYHNPRLLHPDIKHIQVFATKPGIIKTDDEIHGVVFKGIGADFHWEFFSDKLIDGSLLHISDTARSNHILISEYISKLLSLNTGDNVLLYFIQDPPRMRRLQIAGIYETGLEELDRLFVLGDIAHVQRLNDWQDNEAGGFEILLHNYRDMETVKESVLENIPYTLVARSIRDIYPQIFDWLALLDMNVYVIIFIMILVAGINMITTLLISVLEKTNLIGILKALGAANKLVRNVFLYHAGFLIFTGLLYGNILGIGMTLLQKHYGIVKLSQESYFVDVVPVNFEPMIILALNAGTFLICMLMLVLPSYIISRVSPVKAIIFR
jgi:lipoprotein-releasing system permease protein